MKTKVEVKYVKMIDLTQIISSDMPVFPGTEKPIFHKANTLEKDGFIEKKITMFSHTGTHMDAPAHMLPGGKTLDKYHISHFSGKAFAIDLKENEEHVISVKSIRKYQNILEKVDFVLFNTGWNKFWGQDKYFKGFPTLSEEAALWLCGFNLKGVGVDVITIDPIESKTFPVHHIFFKNNMIVIENLTGLDQIEAEIFFFICMPLKIDESDGSPIRAVAMY